MHTPLTALSSQTLVREVIVQNRAGVHARVAMMISKCVKSYDSNVKIFKGKYEADCSTILDLLSLGAAQGEKLRIEADGPEAQTAIDALCAMFENLFDEGE